MNSNNSNVAHREYTKTLLSNERYRIWHASLAMFCLEALGMRLGPHQIKWSRLLTNHKHLSFLAARGHGKSAFFSFAYPLWRSWREPGVLGRIFSRTDNQLVEFFKILKDGKRFVDEDGLEWVMPPAAEVEALRPIVPSDWRSSWTSHRIHFTNGSRFDGRTFGQEARGWHGHWIVTDDPLKKTAGFSALERQRAHDFFINDVMPCLLPARGSQIVNVGTPLHSDDLHARLRRNPEFHFEAFPGAWVDPATGELRYLWPRLRGAEWHRVKKAAMGSLGYTQEVLLQPMSDEVSLFPASLFDKRPETMAAHLTVGGSGVALKQLGLRIVVGVDIALSAEVGADYTVITVLGVDPLGNRRIIDIVRGKGMPFHEQKRLIEETCRRYHADLCLIESNQMQAVWAAEISRTSDVPVRPFTTGANKKDLEKGVPGLRTLIENGKLWFPRGDEDSINKTDILISELRDFGIHKGKLQGVGSHDDCVMSLWIADQAARVGSWGFDDGAALEAEAVDLNSAEARLAAEEEIRRLAAEAVAGGNPELSNVVKASLDEAAKEHYQERLKRASHPVQFGAIHWHHALSVQAEARVEICHVIPNDTAMQGQIYNTLSANRLRDLDPGPRQAVDAHGVEIVLKVLSDIMGF